MPKKYLSDYSKIYKHLYSDPYLGYEFENEIKSMMLPKIEEKNV